VNSQGNSYTTYSNGGYSYSNAPSKGQPAGSSYYAPSATAAAAGSGFYHHNGGGVAGAAYSTYTSTSGVTSYTSGGAGRK